MGLVRWLFATNYDDITNIVIEHHMISLRIKMVGNSWKTPKPFSTFTFEYENESESESGKAGHKNERELMEYREFRKRTKSSGIILNTVGIWKINTE